MKPFDWREIRKRRQLGRTVYEEPKRLELNWLTPDGGIATQPTGSDGPLGPIEMVVRDPDGIIHPLPGKGPVIIPMDAELMGRYLIGARIPWRQQDMDGDGTLENVYLCAKHMVIHRKDGGKMGRASVVFLDDPQNFPLEIGPVMDTAKSRFGGGFQSPHRAYEMMVKYLGRPLSGAEVTVMAMGSRWQRRYLTDSDGKFEVSPTDDRSINGEWQKYLYVATHHDRSNNDYYITSFPVAVYKNQPEWQSKALGFTLWSIIGAALTLLIVLGFFKRGQWLDNRALVIFNNRKIHRDPE